ARQERLEARRELVLGPAGGPGRLLPVVGGEHVGRVVGRVRIGHGAPARVARPPAVCSGEGARTAGVMYPRRVREYDAKASARLPQPVVGPYELTSRLGRAGAGELFLARRSGIERWFALELSDEGLGPAELTRRRHEAER